LPQPAAFSAFFQAAPYAFKAKWVRPNGASARKAALTTELGKGRVRCATPGLLFPCSQPAVSGYIVICRQDASSTLVFQGGAAHVAFFGHLRFQFRGPEMEVRDSTWLSALRASCMSA